MTLDIATNAFVAQMASSGAKPIHEMTPEEARGLGGMLSALYGPGPEMAKAEDIRIPVRDGADIGARVLTPHGTPRSVLVYIHGGGWVIGALDEFDHLGRKLAERTGSVVVLVDYRLAPEHPYPTAAHDSHDAVKWIDDNMERLAGARLPLIVGGDSAGGNLTAVVAQLAASEGGPEISLQVLVYPVTDCDFTTGSYVDPMNQLLLSADGMKWFWDQYCPDPERRKEPTASPLRGDVTGVAPAVLLTAEHDPLCDEGEAYAEKLRAAGKLKAFKRFERQMHAFFTLVNVLPAQAEGLEWVCEHIDRHLAEKTDTVDALIVGAGFAGMYQLHRFRELGLKTRVIEKADGVGGTWYWNRYPGARCDVESLAYSFSFSPELEQEWVWKEKYPPQPEILEYANHVADRFDLRKDMTFSTRVESAHYDEDEERWVVKTDQGECISAQFLIMATGCLSAAKAPEIPGADRFRGKIYHTGHWPHEGVDFGGQRVAVIGTGSSGIQSIPEIAKQAKELTVFQRTPNFSMPAHNRPLGAEEQQEFKKGYRAYREAQRTSGFGVPVEPPTQSALAVSDEERRATYQAGWDEGSLVSLMTAYNDILTNQDANDTAAEFVREKIRSIVKDPQVAEDLCPDDHPVGTKRPCLDTHYYETFNQEHVHLVNLRRTPLVEITENGIRTSDTEREFDAIVFATGFDAMTGALTRIDIRGKGGLRLQDKWKDGPVSYLGLGLAGFPNMFTVTGPSSPSVLSNMMVSIEQHVDWITDCVEHMRANRLGTIEPTPEAEEEWRAHVEKTGNMTLYPKAKSWYMGDNVPGKPRVFMAYLGVGVYRSICDMIAATGYDGFELTPDRRAEAATNGHAAKIATPAPAARESRA